MEFARVDRNELTRSMTMRNRYTGAIAGVAGVLFLIGAGCRSKQCAKQCATFSVEILSGGQGRWRRRTRAEARSDRDMGRTVIRRQVLPGAEGRGCAGTD